jgi:hypothetical protein
MKTRLMAGVFAFLVAVAAWAGKGKLDGKTYKVTVTETSKSSFADTLTFKNGTFDSSECRQYGFKPTVYAGDGATFTVTAKSDKEGTTEWSGTIKGDSIEGKMVWTKAGQAPINYSFSGTTAK